MVTATHAEIQKTDRRRYTERKISCREMVIQFEIRNHKCVTAWEQL